MRLFLLIPLYILTVNSATVPVLMWGAIMEENAALPVISSQKLGNIVKALERKGYMIVTFAEEQLNLQSFNCHKHNEACLPYVQSRSNKTFYLNVEDPFTVLSSEEVNKLTYAEVLKGQIECIGGSKYIVSFNKSTEAVERSALLRHHDDVINRISNKLDKCSVVYIYTATAATAPVIKHRKKRASDVPIKTFVSGSSSIAEDRFAMVWKRFILHDNKETIEVNFTNARIDVGKLDTTVNITFANDRSLNMFFTLIRGYHVLKHLNIDGNKFRVHELSIPHDMSYACTKLKAFQSSTSNYFEWHGFQMQIFKTAKKSNEYRFSEAWSCSGFVSAAILSGLLSMSIIMAIGFCGITWMLDINNVDRFDDPAGKTITIMADDTN